ncbi:MAG: ATP-binding protein [Dehalococcoidia bacterium]
MSPPRHVGVVVGGALTKTLEVRLDSGRSAQLGQYVTAPLDDGATLVGMVTDILLRSAEAGAVNWPPPTGDDEASALLREVLLDTAVYTSVEVSPYLEVNTGSGQTARARRLTRHFAPVADADQETIDTAFNIGDRPAIHIGNPLGMESLEVCVDIEKLFERSAGIFGKSGTGKTVIALQLLDAMVANSARQATNPDRTVALVFDMHNDYGRELKFQGVGHSRRSLKQLHPSDVAVYSLDPSPGAQVDGSVVIGTRDITPEDLDVLQSATDLTANAVEAAYELHERLGKDWIDLLLAESPPESLVAGLWGSDDQPADLTWVRTMSRIGIHQGSFDNLRRGLRRIVRRQFVQRGSSQIGQVIDYVVKTLQGGKSVVIQFGRHGNDLPSYMLVANMLSRRIWEAYREAKERAASGPGLEPNRLVIVIEEAHKFIDRSLAGQTIFGQIARELRKYNVTLLIIDQRPSQIDTEVLSQIGTRFCLQLDSEHDVDALIGGVSGRSGLRQVIASLESQQQALVFGHALPMPVVVRPPTLEPRASPGGSLRDRLAGGAAPVEEPIRLYGRTPAPPPP